MKFNSSLTLMLVQNLVPMLVFQLELTLYSDQLGLEYLKIIRHWNQKIQWGPIPSHLDLDLS